MQRGSGNDSGMSCHIERKDAKGKVYVPDNADASRTYLNRELITFPEGVSNRTAAIQHRLDTAGLHRKVAKNQTKAIRIILTGTHEQMMQLVEKGKLDRWIDANLRWLIDTFGEDNLVSCVLHMDEKTPHLHATIVPIVTTARKRREREGERKYAIKAGPRLSADDVMSRTALRGYQSSYAAAMKPFGLQRGVIGSTAKHESSMQYAKRQQRQLEEDIARLQEEVENTKEGRNRILALVGRGELAKAKKALSEKDEKIADLERRIARLQQEKATLMQKYKDEIAKLRNGYQAEIAKAISRAEAAEKQSAVKEATILKQKQRIEELDRIAHPERYRLSSGAELVHYFIPNRLQPSIHIWTKVGDEKYDASKHIDWLSDTWQHYIKGETTIHELINDVFSPSEQINHRQAALLGSVLTLATGGPAQAHIGTGAGGSQSDMPWDGKPRKRR